MAESSLQQLSSQLSAHQSESQESLQLFQSLYCGIANCCCPTTSAQGLSATAPRPVPGCHMATPDSLPDQASVEQLLAQLQQVFTSHQDQSQKLTSLAEQLDTHSADQARAIAALQAALQVQDCPQDAKQMHPKDKTAAAELLQLAESMAAALASQAGRLTSTQSQIVLLSDELSQAQALRDAAELEVTACKEQLCVVSITAQRAQTSLQQARARQGPAEGILKLCDSQNMTDSTVVIL